MFNSSEKSKLNTVKLITFIFGMVFIIVCFSLFTVRLRSIVKDSLYSQSSGGEAPGLYGIYKVWLGDPVYPSLKNYPTAMLFNFLFYYGYGYIAKLLVLNPENLPLFTHVLTFIWIVFFLALIYFYLWHKIRRLAFKRNDWMVVAIVFLIPFLAYLGPFTGWWCFTARPDMIAVGFDMIALILFLHFGEQRKIKWIVPVTFFFWLAWSMKQTFVFVWLGVLIVLIKERRLRETVISLAMFLFLSSIIFLRFGKTYIEHVYIASSTDPLSLKQALLVARDVFTVGGYIYIPVIIFIAYYLINRKEKKPILTKLSIIFMVTTFGNILISTKFASWRNYYFSSFSVAQLFLAEYLLLSWESVSEAKKSVLMKTMLFCFAFGLFLSLAYFIFPNRFGRLELFSSQQREEMRKIRKVIISSAKPVFVEPAYFALPWNSGQYPSDVIEWTTYQGIANAKLVITIESRIRERYYAEAFVFNGMWSRLLEESGYRKIAQCQDIIRFVRGNYEE